MLLKGASRAGSVARNAQFIGDSEREPLFAYPSFLAPSVGCFGVKHGQFSPSVKVTPNFSLLTIEFGTGAAHG